LFCSYTRSEQNPSSISSPFCYAIKLQVSLLLLPLSIYPKGGLGALKKEKEKKGKKRERKKKNKRKRTNVPT
jgi:hypothetical protein